MAEPIAFDAPITAVTVYPSQARVVRRGTAAVAAGVHDVRLDGLPVSLVEDSVRVSGRGAAQIAAQIVGVEVAHSFHAEAPDARVQSLQDAVDELLRTDQGLVDSDTAQATTVDLLAELARRGGRSFAAALASGEADAARLAAFTETITSQLADVQAQRRAIADQRRALGREIEARQAELASLRAQQGTERRAVVVTIEADADTAVELDVTYIVTRASWQPVYDARLDGTAMTVTWHGLVSQRTGEDWPATDLALSTARPALSTMIPELDPWFLDAWQPVPRMARRVARSVTGESDAMAAPMVVAQELGVPQATVEQGPTAATYRLARPVAVPSDGSPHKATITTLELPAALDHITLPKLAEEAYLRATVTNSSEHTLLPGRVSVFHGADFVGTTDMEVVAPGEELELQLGVDDRLRVERKLVKRTTSKAVLGSTRKTAVAYEITVESHLPDATTLTVLDQFPVSRHEDIKVREQQATPAPSERTDLDLLTWTMPLEPGATQRVALSFQLEHPRDLAIAGWQE